MKGLVLNPATKRQVEVFTGSPSHALLLVGPAGSGKSSLAAELSQSILGIEKLQDYPYAMVIAPEEGKALGIEPVRRLEHFLSLKVPGPARLKRVVTFEDAHTLTTEAQNALLKTLEEPPADTFIVLNVAYEQALLPTVRSRAVAIQVKQPEKSAVAEHFRSQGFTDEQIAQAYAISGGLPGLMTAMLGESDHPLLLATAKARELLSSTTYERLLQVDELSKQKQLAYDTVLILQQMAHTSLQSAEARAAKRWQNILETSYGTLDQLNASAQPKLVLTNLCLQL